MVEEQATVVAVEDHVITVTSNLKSGCSGCQQVDNCGTGQVAKAFPQKKLILKISSDLPLKVGDNVIVALPEKSLLSTAFQVYFLPLAGLMIFAWIAQMLIEQHIFTHELWAVVFGAMGGIIGFQIAKHRQKRPKVAASLQPVITKILPQTISVTQIPR